MKNYIATVLFLLFAATSCVTQRKCLEKYPPAIDTIKTVIFKDSIVYRDTIVYVRIPGQVIRDTIVIPCPPPPPEYIPDTARAETSMATAKAWWSYPVIALELVQKDQTFTFKLDSALRDAYHWRSEYDRVTQVIKQKYIPKWVSFFAITGGVLIALVIGVIIAKFKMI